jgi:hypothetical protein
MQSGALLFARLMCNGLAMHELSISDQQTRAWPHDALPGLFWLVGNLSVRNAPKNI